MKDWAKLFASYSGSGVYNIKQNVNSSEIEHIAVSHGLAFFKVDLSSVADKEGFLRIFSKTLVFPHYFGMNWDAFEECLTDFEWGSSPGYVIMVQEVEAFSHKVPHEFKIAHSIFKSAARYWKMQKKPFFVILVNK